MPSILLLCSASLGGPAGAAGFTKGSRLPEAGEDVQEGKREDVPPGKALSRRDAYRSLPHNARQPERSHAIAPSCKESWTTCYSKQPRVLLKARSLSYGGSTENTE